jgi:hypothetical protein
MQSGPLGDLVGFLFLTVGYGLLLALPPFAIALLFLWLMPNRRGSILIALISLEFVLALFWVYWGIRKDNTGLFVLFLFPVLFAILIGNYAAVPAARRIRRLRGPV